MHAGELIPQIDAGAVRAKPRKVDVRVERAGADEATLEVLTKGLGSVSELGERLAEQMVTELDIEEAFKLYYVDNEGDTMLVSAHTSLRDLIYSEQITAKVHASAHHGAPPLHASEQITATVDEYVPLPPCMQVLTTAPPPPSCMQVDEFVPLPAPPPAADDKRRKKKDKEGGSASTKAKKSVRAAPAPQWDG